jgi:hypothetical protein
MFMNSTMRSLTLTLLLTGILFLGIPSAQAEHKCDNGTLNDTYRFVATGSDFSGPEIHFLLVGTATFDGQGNISGATTESFEGHIEPGITFAGTYTVNADCTGSMTINGNHPGTTDGFLPARTDTHHLNFVIGSKGKELDLIFTDTGNVIGASMKRQ